MSGETKPITVRQLVEILMELPLDLPVYVEGCDCWGECSGARTDDGHETSEGTEMVLVTRGGA
jgi:hypothetical protein